MKADVRRWGWVLTGGAIAAASLTIRPGDQAVAVVGKKDLRAGTVAQAAAPKVVRASRASVDLESALEKLKGRNLNADSGDAQLFVGRSWIEPPKPAAPVVQAPVAPPPPEFPFRVFGKVAIADEPVFLILAKADNPHPVKEGETLEQFRIDRIGDEDFSATHVPTRTSYTFRYEQLYGSAPAVVVAAPVLAPAMAAQAPVTVPPMAQASPSKPTDAKKANDRDKKGSTGMSIGTTGSSATSAPGSSPMNPAQAPASAPGMPVKPATSGTGGMQMTAPAQGGGMVMTKPAPGTGMVMTPPPAGSTGPVQTVPQGAPKTQ